MWVCEDRVIGRSGNAGVSAAQKQLSAIGRAGIDDDGFRAGTPKLRLEDMDRDGLWASVIYGPLALGFADRRPRAPERVLRRVERLGGRGVQRGRPGSAVRARVPARALARGRGRSSSSAARRSVTTARSSASSTSTSATRPGTGCGARRPDTGLPISFHIKGGTSSKLSYRIGKWQSAAFATLLPLQLDEPLATMVFCGALERHPGLKLVLAESGIGWLPYFLARMDVEWRASAVTSSTTRRASRRASCSAARCIATFEEDALGGPLIPLLGADSCMWASDYPHTDSTFPNSRDAIEETLGALPAEDRRKITATNCARLYGFAS